MKMKPAFIILLGLLATTYAYAADQDCDDASLFPTIPAHCQCIMTNAVNDCTANSPIQAVCNPTKLSSYFKEDPAGAEAQCEKYRDKTTPDECVASVTFYDTNC